jgi:hypothetical protein
MYGSDSRVTLENTQLIESPRRIAPDARPKKYNESSDRGSGDRHPLPSPPPHDTVEISPSSHSSQDSDCTLLPENDTLQNLATEHHLDIQALSTL